MLWFGALLCWAGWHQLGEPADDGGPAGVLPALRVPAVAGRMNGGGPRRERAIGLPELVAGRPLALEVCRRCSGRHEGLPFHRFDPPLPVAATALITDWAPCPTTGEPILLVVETIPEPVGVLEP